MNLRQPLYIYKPPCVLIAQLTPKPTGKRRTPHKIHVLPAPVFLACRRPAQDGSLIGHLWANLPSALTEIAATLQTRENRRRSLPSERRVRAKIGDANDRISENPTIPTVMDGGAFWNGSPLHQ